MLLVPDELPSFTSTNVCSFSELLQLKPLKRLRFARSISGDAVIIEWRPASEAGSFEIDY